MGEGQLFYSSRNALKKVAVDSSISTLIQSNNYLNLAMTSVEDLLMQILSNATSQVQNTGQSIDIDLSLLILLNCI